MAASKQLVKVRADHLVNGRIRPLMFRTEDGPVCRIDRIIDERKACSLKSGGQGIRYTCVIGTHRLYLFHDEDIWFIEVPIES